MQSQSRIDIMRVLFGLFICSIGVI